MNRLFFIFLLLLSIVCRGDVATEPWPKKLQDFPLKKGVLTVRNFKITVHHAANQEASGTGGSAYDFTILDLRTGAKRHFTDQSAGVAILEFHHGWPQIENWGRAGGGSWSRSLHRFTQRDYEYVRTDVFTEFDFNAKDKTRTTTLPNDEDILYFVETRLPEK